LFKVLKYSATVVRPEDVVARYVDGNGHETKFTIDKFGAAAQTIDALGYPTDIERDDNSNPTKITQANGEERTFTYDSVGNVLTVTQETIGTPTTLTYEPEFNQVTSIQDPNGNPPTTIIYDGNGNPMEITDAKGTKTKLEYTDTSCTGQVTKVTSALGLEEETSTSFTYYSKSCNVETIIDPLGKVTTLEYDSYGNVKKTTDAEDKSTQFFYDSLNRLTKVISAEGGSASGGDADSKATEYRYDEAGNLKEVTDANIHPTKFEYDTKNRLSKMTDPLGKFEVYTYDGNGNLFSTTDRKLQTINFAYDEINQLIKKTLPGNWVTNFTYDTVGNLLTVVDPDSNLTFGYDGASRLTSADTKNSTNQPAVKLTYGYDKNSNRLTMAESGAVTSGTTTYTYDQLNRLSTLKSPSTGSSTINFGYDALSRRTSLSYPNTTSASYSYDDASQLLQIKHQASILNPLSSFTYTYDKVGNRTDFDTTRTGVSSLNSHLDYTYDVLYRLTQATRPEVGDPNETFKYDPVGNRLRRDGQASDAAFDSANRLLEDTEYTYTSDDNGNLIEKDEKKSGGDIVWYTYDAQNQLIGVQFDQSGVVVEYR
jgi:YD repeat-containing protein